MSRSLGALLVVLLAFSTACSKKEEASGEAKPEPAMPPPIGEVEADRGRRACADYAKKMCALAEESPDDAERQEACSLARARPQALDMNLRVARAPDSDLDPRDVAAVMVEARKIAAGCLEDLASLD